MKSYQIIISMVATLALSGCNISISPVEDEQSAASSDTVVKKSVENRAIEENKSSNKAESNSSESNESGSLLPPELRDSSRPRVVPKEMPSMPPELVNVPKPKVVKEAVPSMPPEFLNKPVHKVVKDDLPSAPPGVDLSKVKNEEALPPPPFLDHEPTKVK